MSEAVGPAQASGQLNGRMGGPKAELPARYPGMDRAHVWFYASCRGAAQAVMTLLFRFRRGGLHNVPDGGPLIIVANHQSFLDPPAVGLCCPRRACFFMARSTLFKFGPFGKLIEWLNSIPLKQGESDVKAMRAALERLQRGGAVVLFPEGSRSMDGRMEEFQAGVAVIIKRAKCPVLPVGLDGMRDAFPRGGAPVLWGRPTAAVVGEPISAEELAAMDAKDMLRRIGAEVDGLRLKARDMVRGASGGRLPMHPEADEPTDVESWYAD